MGVRRICGLFGVLAVGCANGEEPPSTATSLSGGLETAPAQGDEPSSGGDELPPLEDLPAPPEGAGCNGVDFLFVVDNSLSMKQQQTRLLASFEGFIESIEENLDDVTSYHVGVVTSDAYEHNSSECNQLGDLVTRTGGEAAYGQECGPFADGRRFASNADDLRTQFPCLAQVGIDGSREEFPVSVAASALAPEKLAPGGCNDGFLRDGAILVIVVVTDDPPFDGDQDDAHASAEGNSWYEDIVAAKGGDESGVVVIGFVPWDDLSCLTYAADSPNLIEFVQSFGDHGVLASVCDPSYVDTFSNTVSTIAQTCTDYVPVG